MAKGLLYFAQNSAFQHLTKIGKTTKLDVEDRGLSASNVPKISVIWRYLNATTSTGRRKGSRPVCAFSSLYAVAS